MSSAILEKAKDKTLKTICAGQLLEEILKHESIESREFAKSLIVFPYIVSTRKCVANFRNFLLEQLKNFGTIQACFEIQRVAQKLPELTWLKKTLLDAQNKRSKRLQAARRLESHLETDEGYRTMYRNGAPVWLRGFTRFVLPE